MHSNHDVGDSSGNESRTVSILEACVRLLLLLFVWSLLTKGDPASWIVGFPAALFATVVGVWMPAVSSWRWGLSGFLSFVPFFAYCSLKGGVDVASRAFSLSLPLAPAMLNYSLRLRKGTSRVFFANAVSLLPGTLSADIRGDTLFVHVLDNALPVFEQLQRLEVAVARLFGRAIDSENAEGTEA